LKSQARKQSAAEAALAEMKVNNTIELLLILCMFMIAPVGLGTAPRQIRRASRRLGHGRRHVGCLSTERGARRDRQRTCQHCRRAQIVSQ
jgi:hypothetical protein